MDIERLNYLSTPRQAPTASDEDEEDEDIEVVPEYRNRNKTDAEEWEEWVAKYPTLGAAAESLDSMRKILSGCSGNRGQQPVSQQEGGPRRDYSILLEGQE